MIPEFSTSPMILLVWIVTGYLLGSIPFGLVVAHLFGLGDLRQIGSGNIGATNVLRTGSKLGAALTLIADAGKAGITVFLARSIAGEDAAQLAGFAAFWQSQCRASSWPCCSVLGREQPCYICVLRASA